MTQFEIHDYIDHEHAVHSKNKITRAFLNNGDIWVGQLLAADQNIPESLKSNKWRFRHPEFGTIEINGEEVMQLKVG